MLEALRRGAQTRVAKLLFGLLVASFSIWGVHDVFRGWGRGAIATVGSTSIPDEEFRRAYQDELERISQQARRRITSEQGHSFGLDRQVLSQLVNGAAIENHARDLGLDVSDATLAKSVESDANFHGPDGKFAKAAFDNFLRQIGLTEQGYFALRRKDELRGALFRSLIAAQTVPKPLFDAMHAYNGEKRILEWVKIDPAAITVAEPDEAKLKGLYEADKAKYMTPEFRKVEALRLTPDDLKKQYKITDEEIKAAYEKSKDDYDKPELRRVQQLSFKDKTTADTALKALRDGTKSFGDIAKETGAKDTDVDLGLISKKALIDRKVADAAFALEKDKYSDVVDGTFSQVVLRVTQIEPGETHTFDQVKDKVKDKIADERAQADLSNKRDEVDDARFAGKTLAEIGKQMGLTYDTIPALDATGLTPEGKPALDTPDVRKIAQRAFAPDSSTDDSAIELSEGGYAWANVLSTEPPKQRPFEAVKEQVKKNYMTSERARLIAELAKKLTDSVNAGAPLASIAGEAKNKVEKTDAITRKTVPQSLPEALVAQAFRTQSGKAGHALTSDKSTEIVFRVAEVIPAAAVTQSETENLNRQLSTDLASQTFTEYTEALKKRYGAKINETELKTVLGVSDE